MNQPIIFFTGIIVFRVLERLGPRALSNHLRVFADYLVFEFSSSAGGAHVNRVRFNFFLPHVFVSCRTYHARAADIPVWCNSIKFMLLSLGQEELLFSLPCTGQTIN